MNYSMMSYTMARDPETFDIPKILDLTNELGMSGIDFVTLYDHKASDLKKMADDKGVPVVCHTFKADLNHPDPESRQAGIEDVKRGLEAAVTLGAPCVMIITPGKNGVDRSESRKNWIAGLKEACRMGADAGVTVTVENFPGADSPFVIADDFLEAVKEVPDLKLTYDNGNVFTGEEPSESFRRCADYAVHAHFKDWDVSTEASDGYRKMLDGRHYRSALIGEASIDHAACLAAMKEAGYNGHINIEYEGNKYKPEEAVRRAVDYLRNVE